MNPHFTAFRDRTKHRVGFYVPTRCTCAEFRRDALQFPPFEILVPARQRTIVGVPRDLADHFETSQIVTEHHVHHTFEILARIHTNPHFVFISLFVIQSRHLRPMHPLAVGTYVQYLDRPFAVSDAMRPVSSTLRESSLSHATSATATAAIHAAAKKLNRFFITY